MAKMDIYSACYHAADDGDTEALLRCVIDRFDDVQHNTDTNVNSQLLVISGSLVFFMQAGFAMLCAGSVRKKNTQNTMLKNLLDACGAAIAYFCVGYGFSFGGDNSLHGGDEEESHATTFIGWGNFFARGDIDLSFYFFQYTFAAASVTIVAGALAERCQMAAYLCYSFFLTGIVYPVAVHAVWSSQGFLSPDNDDPLLGIGMVDFSGSGVIHMTGGTTALIAVYLLGSRRGRFYDLRSGELLEEPKKFPGHSVSLQMLGSFILWFGWFGFNAGSALLLTDNPYQNEISALCAVNTFLASGAGCISALLANLIHHRIKTNGQIFFDLSAGMNGALSGLVAITAGCATLEPWAALTTGAIAGILFLLGSHMLVVGKLDDVVDAIPVHFVSGLWGLLSVGLLSAPSRMLKVYGDDTHPGLFYSFAEDSPNANLLGCQVLGALFIIGWTTVTMLPFFLALNFAGLLRCESVEELVGLDVTYNGGGKDEKGCDSDMDERVKDEYFEAYEELKLKNRKIRKDSAHGTKSQCSRSQCSNSAASN